MQEAAPRPGVDRGAGAIRAHRRDGGYRANRRMSTPRSPSSVYFTYGFSFNEMGMPQRLGPVDSEQDQLDSPMDAKSAERGCTDGQTAPSL
jgi:hypothetical protein